LASTPQAFTHVYRSEVDEYQFKALKHTSTLQALLWASEAAPAAVRSLTRRALRRRALGVAAALRAAGHAPGAQTLWYVTLSVWRAARIKATWTCVARTPYPVNMVRRPAFRAAACAALQRLPTEVMTLGRRTGGPPAGRRLLGCTATC